MEITTALIWTLRIVLPIILFCIYFRFQSSKDDQLLLGSSGKNKYPRSKLLAHRQAAPGDEVPKELATVALKSQEEAPELFQGGERSGKGKGGGKKGREPREDRPEKGGKDRDRRPARDSEKTEKPKRKEKDAENGSVPVETIPPVQLAEVPTELPPSARGALDLKESEEKMNLESFLNYVAFNKKTQAPTSQVLDLSEASAERANAEAQMVLRGSMGFKRVDVSKDLFAQLDAASVEVFATTFTLMIEACVVARDLKSASDFLMNMEASGHSPNSELLDKVLDLYSNQKSQKDVSKLKEPQNEGVVDGEFDMEAMSLTRQKLKSDAPIFVPSFGIPPPPPKPKPVEEDDEEGGANDSPSQSRTRLTSAARPFEPNQSTEAAPAEDQKAEVRDKKAWSKHGKKGAEEGRKMWKPKEPAAVPVEA